MSLLQNQDFIIYRIRSRYLHCVKDGVGERLITLNPAALNVPAFKNAGWGAEIKRCYSPPIKTGSAAGEYFANSYVAKSTYDGSATPVASTGGVLFTTGADTTADANPMGLGPVDNRHIGVERTPKIVGTSRSMPRRIREVREDDDSSDMSDDSDDDDNMQSSEKTTKIEFDFSKKEVPVRPRAGSSPIRNGPQVLVSSPSFHVHHKTRSRGRIRGGSHGDIDLKPADYDNLPSGNEDLLSSGVIAEQERIHAEIAKKLRSAPGTSLPRDGEFDSGDESEASSTMSSDFVDTVDSNPVDNNLAPSVKPVTATSLGVLHALPPPIRPISQYQPVSLLTRMLKAKESEADNPMDAYRAFSGKGELTPIYLKLYIPYAKKSSPFEIILNRLYKEPEEDGGRARETTVAEAIGFALYRYIEEKKEPQVKEEMCNINRWTLRMVDDGEPDDDFPPLERTQPVTAYMTKKAPRGRLGAANKEVKMEGEFALVEATSEQYAEHERNTPSKAPRKSSATPSIAASLAPSIPPSEHNAPLMATLGPSARQVAAEAANSITAAPRTGPSKILRIHVSSIDEFAQSISICVTTDTYIAEVLDQVCRKKHLDKRNFVLRVSGVAPPVVAPLDRTVASLRDHTDLDLMRRRFVSAVEGLGDRPGSPSTVASPNAPLDLATGRTPKKAKFLQPAIWTPDMLSSRDYLKFTVWRKASMSFMSRHERILAIDGEYVHIMPSDQKTLLNAFESQAQAKTRSIHISTIIGTKTYRKAPSSFKILVWRAQREQKRYDFEAMSEKEAAEVVEALRKATQAYRMDHSSMG